MADKGGSYVQVNQLSPKPLAAAPQRGCLWGSVRHILIFCGGALCCFLPSIIILLAMGAVGNESETNDGLDPNRAVCHKSILNSHTLGDFFAITYSAGHLSWKQAKAIDVAYNLVIGRGLQTALALLSSRLFLGALLRNAESTALPYATYASMAFQHGSTASAWQLLKNVFGLPGLRRKLTMLCLLCSTCWILAVPTVLDLMSGYVPQRQAMIRLSNGFLEPWVRAVYDDVDGREYRIADASFYGTVSSLNGTFRLGNESWPARELFSLDGAVDAGPSYGFGVAREEAFACLNGNSYEWGVSGGIIMFIWIPFMTIWCMGMYILWLDIHRNSQLWRSGRRLGMWRCILDLAEAVAEDLGPESSTLSNAELEKEVGRLGPVGYQGSVPVEGKPVGHVGLSSRTTGKV